MRISDWSSDVCSSDLLSDRLYELFLDRDRQYSCAYFIDPDNSLEQAQLDKKAHIAAKLALKPGQRVLDIGCGWGGMALYLHEKCGVDVLGITDRKSTRLNFSHKCAARMPATAWKNKSHSVHRIQ